MAPVPTEDASRVTYRFRIEAVTVNQDPAAPSTDPTAPAAAPEVERTALTVAAAESDGIRPAGRVLSLAAERIVESTGGDVSVTPIRKFAQPIVVRIPYEEADDPGSLAVYRLNEQTGRWEYRGGTVNVEGRYVERGRPDSGGQQPGPAE